jgi:VWFA-related protein
LTAARAVGISAAADQPPPQDPQRPVFRAGAYFVTVDAYPLQNGRVMEGLTADDFQILEDGRPQKIEAFEFVRVEAAAPDALLRDPGNDREMLAQVADQRTRVFVAFLDAYHTGLWGSNRLRQPMIDMLNGILAPTDLFGVMTPVLEPRHLVFARKTTAIEEQLTRYWTWGDANWSTRDRQEEILADCYNTGGMDLGDVIARRREDRVLTSLELLVERLGHMREGRKSVFVFTGGWRLFEPSQALENQIAKLGVVGRPPIGVTSGGQLRMGNRLDDGTFFACDEEVRRLAQLDDGKRFRDLLGEAARANVAFYPVSPEGVMATGRSTDTLASMASETDGVAVVMTNDLARGLERVTAGLSAYYLLGYGSTNTRFDGGPRSIKVTVNKPGVVVKARRGYRAPTREEIDSIRSSRPAAGAGATAIEAALAPLARLRPSSAIQTHGRVAGSELAIVVEIGAQQIEAGHWRQGGDVQVIVTTESGDSVGTAAGRIEPGSRATLVRVPVAKQAGPFQAAIRMRGEGETAATDRLTVRRADAALVGDALVYRSASGAQSAVRPSAGFQFLRSERVRVEWPVLKPLDRREARLLGASGSPLAVPVTVTERELEGGPVVNADLSLAPLSPGDYVIELTVGAGEVTEKKLVAIRVVR